MRENENRKNIRKLRKQQTDAELRLWYFLRGRRFQGLKFRRQYAVGSYICDFVCVEAKLVIELDGGQHVMQQAYDKKRTDFLQSQDFTVLRFWNDDVLKATEVVLERMMLHLRIPSPQPSPVNGRGAIAPHSPPQADNLHRGQVIEAFPSPVYGRGQRGLADEVRLAAAGEGIKKQMSENSFLKSCAP